jgi:pantoate--beta-alanine ligase
VQIVVEAQDLATRVADARAAGQKVAFVPTMGALHDGHLSLVKLAKEKADFVVVSIFVNPLQFGQGEDFDRYPRNLEADAARLAEIEADLIFAPTVQQIYPSGASLTKTAGPVGEVLEGEARPGHFDGMLTVVARLFDLVHPDVAIFGAKDAQQLHLITKMAAADYSNIQIVSAPIVRELSGLAMSSRNAYLSEGQRESAAKIYAALKAAKDSAVSPSAAIEVAETQLNAIAEAKLGYISLVNAETFEPVLDGFSGRALLLVAAEIGKTRLIDNIEITL